MVFSDGLRGPTGQKAFGKTAAGEVVEHFVIGVGTTELTLFPFDYSGHEFFHPGFRHGQEISSWEARARSHSPKWGRAIIQFPVSMTDTTQ